MCGLANILADLGTAGRPGCVEICRDLARAAGNEADVEAILAGN